MKHTHAIVGYTRKGRPIHAIAGASGEPAPPAQEGGEQRGEQRGEQPPAQPAPTSTVDPGNFNRGAQEQWANSGQGQPPPAQQQPQAGDPNPATGRVFTEAEVEEIRRQERDKLYPRIESMQDDIKQMREAREAEQRAQAEEEARAEEARRESEEGEMDVRDLIRRKESEWTERFEQVEKDARMAQAALEQERRFNALNEYKRQQLEANADNIMPQLRGYVTGNTEEEIDASIQQQIETTQSVFSDLAQAQQAQSQQVPTTRVTAPGDAGPLEQQGGATKQFSEQDIANMTPAEWAQNRDAILAAASRVGPYGQR